VEEIVCEESKCHPTEITGAEDNAVCHSSVLAEPGVDDQQVWIVDDQDAETEKQTLSHDEGVD
jgi:hypothetical protein